MYYRAVTLVALAALAVGCSTSETIEPLSNSSEVRAAGNDVAYNHPGLSWAAQPPGGPPWNGMTLTWTVNATNCGVLLGGCTVTWRRCTYSSGCLLPDRQVNGILTSDTYTRTATPVDSNYYMNVEVENSTNGSEINSVWVNTTGVRDFSISGTRNIFSSGNYTYSANVTGNTWSNCSGMAYQWGGDASGTGASALVYYSICPRYSYNNEIILTITSKGYAKEKNAPIFINTNESAC